MKIYAITLVLLVAILVLASCGTTVKDTDFDTTLETQDKIVTTDSNENSSILDDLTLNEAISIYISRVKAISEEQETYKGETKYFAMKIGEYEFETRNTGEVEVLYRDHTGFRNAKYFSLHLPTELKYDYEVLSTPKEAAVIEDNCFTLYRWGEKQTSVELPETYIYCGHTAWGAAVIRVEDVVYLVDTVSINEIATGVKRVLSTEYEFSSDDWDSILFLMNDGTVKAYIDWQTDLQEPFSFDGCEGEWYNVYRPLTW
ncbi:MAG: hypothetical protein IKV94_00945 [Clostridia bacterium]|nr:hypothetical protein [Clostridia bacterium]